MKLENIYIRSLWILSIVVIFPPIDEGVSIVRNVGQDAVFMWNRTSGSISEAQWGLYDNVNQVVKPSFIYINKFFNRPVLSGDLDTSAASRYKGRVFWVGDILAGRAWYKITNLSISDTKDYAVRLQDGNAVDTFHKMSLTVAATPSFPHFPTSPYFVYVSEGTNLVINCTATGPPTPTVQWFTSDGTEITSASVTGTVTLNKTNVQRSHNGTKYKCVASNNPNTDLLSTVIQVVVLYPPNSTVTPASITVIQGRKIILSCTADGYPPPSISWTKAGGVIKAGYTLTGGTLRIPDAIKTDAGKYICTANNTYDSREHTKTAHSIVVVVYQPSIILERFSGNQTVNETDSLSIRCDADGFPSPTIKWKTPTGSVHTGNVYTIPSVSRSHTGTYTCTASNGIGREATATAQVTVQYKPVIDGAQSSSKFKSWHGNSIRLRCLATGLPTPQISWYKPTNQQITTGVNIVPGGSEVTVLTTTDQRDYGQYKCRATNILGSDKHVINVTQLSSPGPVILTVSGVEASSISVTWTEPSVVGGHAVTGYLLEVSSKPPRITVNTHAIITGLIANTQYTVKVYARNAIGYGVVSSKVITTEKTGKPAVPDLLTAILEQKDSRLLVVLRWKEPDYNGGNITRYTIYMKEVEENADWTKYVNITNLKTLEYRITKGIFYGKTYIFLVTAWNIYGESVRDERDAKIINTTATKATSSTKASPGPVIITVSEVEASSMTVIWTKSTDDGGSPVTDYLLEVSTKPPRITVNTHAVITRLEASKNYTVKVYARNAIGYGVVSSKIIRTEKTGKPAIPDLLTAILEQKEARLLVVLRWKEPDDNGGNITMYTIYMKEVEENANWTKYVNITDLKTLEYRITKGVFYGKTYMFLVTAWNKYGESVREERDAKIVNTTATKVTYTKASPGPVIITVSEVEASSMTVIWTKPTDDGGSPVTDYLLEVSTKPPRITVNTHAVITGLIANTQYTVKVYARNAIGYGLVSSKVIRTEKTGKPAVPDLLTAILEQKESRLLVVLRWKEPDDNGENITRYTIYMKKVEENADWIKYVDITDLKTLEYRITKGVFYGKTYMFLVTAWNIYGESVRDKGGANIINTTTTKASSTKELEKCYLQSTEKPPEFCTTVIGVIVAILVLSFVFNLLQLLYLRKVQSSGVKESPTQKRKPQKYGRSYDNELDNELEERRESTVAASPSQQPAQSVSSDIYEMAMVEQSFDNASFKSNTAGESHENDLELEKGTRSKAKASREQHYTQCVSGYEVIDQLIENANPNEDRYSNNISNYQELTTSPNRSSEGSQETRYEPLCKSSDGSTMQHDDDETHIYEPVDIKDQKHAYQSLHTDSRESASET